MGEKLKEIVTVRFSEIMVEILNSLNIKSVGIKFMVEFMSVKSVGEFRKNSEISILKKNILSSFKKPLLELIKL